MLPLPDAVEKGTGVKSRTSGGTLACIAEHHTLLDNLHQASVGNVKDYYRFYQTDILAFYLPDTHILTIATVEF